MVERKPFTLMEQEMECQTWEVAVGWWHCLAQGDKLDGTLMGHFRGRRRVRAFVDYCSFTCSVACRGFRKCQTLSDVVPMT